MAEDRYKVVLGASITEKETGAAWCDMGIVYYDMGYAKMVQVENVLTKHAKDIVIAVQPAIDDLMKLGLEDPKAAGSAKAGR